MVRIIAVPYTHLDVYKRQVQDVTAEMVERHRIEYERDYDVLTNLLNRRAFQRFAQERFEHPEQLKITAFMMMDLDNLKSVSYTHLRDTS